jgi:hypothetical protein
VAICVCEVHTHRPGLAEETVKCTSLYFWYLDANTFKKKEDLEGLSNKLEALSSNPSTIKKNFKKQDTIETLAH